MEALREPYHCSRVQQIERTLEKAEDSLVKRVALFAACLHWWRFAACQSRAQRQRAEELNIEMLERAVDEGFRTAKDTMCLVWCSWVEVLRRTRLARSCKVAWSRLRANWAQHREESLLRSALKSFWLWRRWSRFSQVAIHRRAVEMDSSLCGTVLLVWRRGSAPSAKRKGQKVLRRAARSWAYRAQTAALRQCWADWCTVLSHSVVLRQHSHEMQREIERCEMEHRHTCENYERRLQVEHDKVSSSNLASRSFVCRCEKDAARSFLRGIFTILRAHAQHVHERRRLADEVVARWRESTSRSQLRTCVLQWKHVQEASIFERTVDRQTVAQQEEWGRLLAIERQDASRRDLLTLDRCSGKLERTRSSLAVAVKRWHVHGPWCFPREVLLAWRRVTESEHTWSELAVQAAVMQTVQGHEKNVLRLCWLCWTSCVERQRAKIARDEVSAKWWQDHLVFLQARVFRDWVRVHTASSQRQQLSEGFARALSRQQSRHSITVIFRAWRRASCHTSCLGGMRLQWADVVNRRASRALLADVLHALSLCAERGKHERQLHDEFERRELEHVSTEETRIKLEEQLWLAYAQIKDLSSSLQMEKLARQELAADVQDVFDRMREPVFGNSPSCLTTTTASSSPSPGRPRKMSPWNHSLASPFLCARPIGGPEKVVGSVDFAERSGDLRRVADSVPRSVPRSSPTLQSWDTVGSADCRLRV